MRYPGDAIDGEGYYAFPNANAFHAHYMSCYFESCSSELMEALKLTMFTLEQDHWNHMPEILKNATNSRIMNHTWRITILNVS
jgi:hypothetical protein